MYSHTPRLSMDEFARLLNRTAAGLDRQMRLHACCTELQLTWASRCHEANLDPGTGGSLSYHKLTGLHKCFNIRSAGGAGVVLCNDAGHCRPYASAGAVAMAEPSVLMRPLPWTANTALMFAAAVAAAVATMAICVSISVISVSSLGLPQAKLPMFSPVQDRSCHRALHRRDRTEAQKHPGTKTMIRLAEANCMKQSRLNETKPNAITTDPRKRHR